MEVLRKDCYSPFPPWAWACIFRFLLGEPESLISV